MCQEILGSITQQLFYTFVMNIIVVFQYLLHKMHEILYLKKITVFFFFLILKHFKAFFHKIHSDCIEKNVLMRIKTFVI